MSRIPGFIETLDKVRELHIKKNEDYATADNPFFNFDFTEYILSKFKRERDKVFVWPIANKIARLAALLSSNRTPNNESIEDSFDDIITYAGIWKCDIARRRDAYQKFKDEIERFKEEQK